EWFRLRQRHERRARSQFRQPDIEVITRGIVGFAHTARRPAHRPDTQTFIEITRTAKSDNTNRHSLNSPYTVRRPNKLVITVEASGILHSLCSERPQDGLKSFPDVGGDDFVALGGRVNAVGKVEFAAAAHSFKNKRNEHGIVLFCNIDEDRFELSAIVAAHVRRNFHPRHNYFDFLLLIFTCLDDRLKLRFSLFWSVA